MMLLLQIVLAAVLLRAVIQTGLGLCQIAIGLIAGMFGLILYVVAGLLDWLVRIWLTAIQKPE